MNARKVLALLSSRKGSRCGQIYVFSLARFVPVMFTIAHGSGIGVLVLEILLCVPGVDADILRMFCRV